MDSSARSLFVRIAETYYTRILLCVACSLVLLIIAVRAPIFAPTQKVGWQVSQHSNDPVLTLIEVREQSENRPVSATGVQTTEPSPDPVADAEPEPREEVPDPEPPAPEPEEAFEHQRTLTMVYENVQEMPEVEGGLTSYYLNIEYPRAALIARIQGSLLLTFIVEPNGRASNITVTEPLHPLTDSAAVRALRRTRFVPGKQDGRRVPVRMQLPVRFEIVDNPIATTETEDE